MTINRFIKFSFIAKEYLAYFLDRTDQHSLQTPFAYTVYRNLMNHYRMNQLGDPFLENLRARMKRDKWIVNIEDEGAGSHYFTGMGRSIASVCNTACSPLALNLLYQYFVSETPSQIVLELGTSLGINTGYLAAKTRGTVYTFESDATLLKIAAQNLGIFSNIRFIKGKLQESLPKFLEAQPQIDFIQIDANHTYEATVTHCRLIWPYIHEKTIVVLGDIHWSADMKKAWREIKKFPNVSASMDFFECGVLFFKRGIQTEHHILYYPI